VLRCTGCGETRVSGRVRCPRCGTIYSDGTAAERLGPRRKPSWLKGYFMGTLLPALVAVAALLAVTGVAVGVFYVLQPNEPSPLVMLWCGDHPSWVAIAAEDTGRRVPPAVDEADEYLEEQENWIINDRGGYFESCRAAWEGYVGAVPPDSEPLPAIPPHWHVWARGYSSGQEGDNRWLVVYQGEVWACDELQVGDGDGMNARFQCVRDPAAPYPEPGTY
jgi:hypothetical protein